MNRLFFGMALLGAAVLSSCSGNKNQQAEENVETTEAQVKPEFLRLNAMVTLDPANSPKVIELAKTLIQASLSDKGVMEYDMYKSETRDNKLLIYETWADQPSLDAHSASDHFTSIVPQIVELGEMGIDQFEQVANPETAGKQIRINCRVVAKEGKKDDIIKAAKELVAASLNDKGVIEYDIMSSVTRPNELLIYETWADQPSLDAHSASDHFTRLVPQIQEMSESMTIQQYYK